MRADADPNKDYIQLQQPQPQPKPLPCSVSNNTAAYYHNILRALESPSLCSALRLNQ